MRHFRLAALLGIRKADVPTPASDDFSPLPDIGHDGIVNGRVPKEGYQRGWGLQFSDLAERVKSESLFQDAFAASQGLSMISPEKRMNLYLLLTRFVPKLRERNVIEFGAFRGGNAIFMAAVLRHSAPEAMVFALDTFEGMPPTDPSIDAHRAGDFSDNSFEEVSLAVRRSGLGNIRLVKGLFQDTFPDCAGSRKFGLAHIDADIYSAVKFAQDAVWDRMTSGGYVAYDDAEISSCLGATQAVEELIMERKIHSEQIWPHFVFRANF